MLHHNVARPQKPEVHCLTQAISASHTLQNFHKTAWPSALTLFPRLWLDLLNQPGDPLLSVVYRGEPPSTVRPTKAARQNYPSLAVADCTVNLQEVGHDRHQQSRNVYAWRSHL